MPRIPWLLVQIGGGCYLLNSFLLLVAPDFAHVVLLIPSFVAEPSLALWLLLKGVDAPNWEAWDRSAPAT